MRLVGQAGNYLFWMNEPHIPPTARRRFKSDMKVDDLELVFDERSTGFVVFPAPFGSNELDAALYEKPCTAVC
jgi:hypothetical protein